MATQWRTRSGARGAMTAAQGPLRVRPHVGTPTVTLRHSVRVLRPCRAVKPWETMQPDLYKWMEEGSLVLSSCDEALDMAEENKAVIIDVRMPGDYEEVHAVDAVSVPIFRPITTVSVANAVKTLFCAINGVKGTEENPEFVTEVAKVYQGMAEDQRLYFMCDAGGTCEPVPGFIYGKQSRSLQAVYKAVDEANVPKSKVGHVRGGLREWAAGGNRGLAGENVEAWKKKAGSVPY
ncbi:hypothetical protein HOP50_16g78860 [Chloropicon primus]|uniref:Rhodanese domain-containing protein n=1 Tax=Chloropicon primus TaxID=1764295 RepID=A0A5B8MWY3_9CHLO|nr:hypothetical protein A3770_16p78560 [Chloropicon primus]UPR04544.1 hypothetical protein HOP50_16g78860 [Chloropicon primus]|eukprot:QDZ25338.1 hypothetical protein A3770_16p78560 [Chloropicon primus]